MIREVDLLGYLPLYVQEYKEIKQIMELEKPEIQSAEEETEIVKNNQFIFSCDEVGIARFEKLLGIKPSKNETLETRITRVFLRWNEDVPYTYKFLLQKLTSLCGSDFEVIPNFNEYEMDIITHLDLKGQVDELQHIIVNMIPCNIGVSSNNVMNYDINASAPIAIGMGYCETYEISNTFRGSFEIGGKSGIVSGVVETECINISNDFRKVLDISSNTSVIATVVNTDCIGVSDDFNSVLEIRNSGGVGSAITFTESIGE